jgi:hypothetical protein
MKKSLVQGMGDTWRLVCAHVCVCGGGGGSVARTDNVVLHTILLAFNN